MTDDVNVTDDPSENLFDNADQIFKAANSRKRVTIFVEEWNGKVTLQEMTGAERDVFERSVAPGTGRKASKQSFRAQLIRECVINSAGEKVFSRGHLDRIAALPARGISRVFDACVDLNGMKQQDVEELTEDFD